MTTPEQALERIEDISRRLDSGELQDQDLEGPLLELEILREQLNARRREADASITLAVRERQIAINDQQMERLA